MTLSAVASFVAFVSLGLGIWLSARSLGWLNEPSYGLSSSYLRPTTFLGIPTIPHFVLTYENKGNVPVTFFDFELALPRLDVLDEDGAFILHSGAQLFIDKRPSADVGVQEFSKIDYRTNKVRLEPQEAHTDFFDLGAFLPEGWTERDWGQALEFSETFRPVLKFRDSFGREYHADAEGIHDGDYVYPHEVEMRRAGRQTWPQTLSVRRQRGFGWTTVTRRHPRDTAE